MERSSSGWRQVCQLNQARSNKRNCWATTPTATRAINNRINRAGLGRANRRMGAGSKSKLANEYHSHLNLNLNAAQCLGNAAQREESDVINRLFLLLEAVEQIGFTDHVQRAVFV